VFEIRGGTTDDLPAARVMHERLLPDLHYDFWHQDELLEDDVFLVALDPDLVGYLWGDLHGISGAASYVREVAVEPGSRRRGVGRGLLGAFARRAADAACDVIYIDPIEGATEEDLILYYERCGFSDPTRWRTTRHQRRGRDRMLEGRPDAVIRGTTHWAPLIATNAWDIDTFGNGAFYEAYLLPAESPAAGAGGEVLRWLNDDHRTHRVVQPVVLLPSGEQAGSAGARSLTAAYEWTTQRRTHVATVEERSAIAMWPSESIMLQLDANRVAPLAVVESSTRRAQEWSAARGAVDIRSGEPVGAFIRCQDPVVEIALRELSLHVNRNTGLAAPEDREAALATLRSLHGSGHRLDPSEIFTFALANRWYGDGGVQLRVAAQRVLQGQSLSRRRHHPMSSDAVNRWRQDAAFL
jgi:GNAT superfamily N-acetyltransferase